MFKHVVVGADASPTAREAVETAVELARLHGATLHIVTASNLDQGPNRARTGGYIDPGHPAEPVLKDLAALAKKAGLKPTMHPTSGAPADAVVGVAEKVGADLIVVGNKGMRGARRVLGSVPNSIAHKAPCSVLIVDTTGAAS